MPHVIGLGEVLWDILPDGTKHLGGAPMNVAVHAAALGCASSVISAVGCDQLGQEAIAQMAQSHRLDVSAVQILGNRPTGAVDIRLVNGQPEYEFRAGVAWDFLEATDAARAAIGQADAIVFGTLAQRSGPSRRAISVLLSSSRPDALRVFDVNLRYPFFDDAVLRDSLRLANVLKLNDGELPTMLGAIGLTSGNEWVARTFALFPQLQLIALTRGEKGSSLYNRGWAREHALPARPTVVEDTVGAGDAFTAALVSGLLFKVELTAVHEQAAKMAAYVCSQPGATPRLPADLLPAWRSC